MVSLPGSLRSLKVCMLMTSSVLTMTGGWGLCLRRRWHLRDTRNSSTMALQKDLCVAGERKDSWSAVPSHVQHTYPPLAALTWTTGWRRFRRWGRVNEFCAGGVCWGWDGMVGRIVSCRGVDVECWAGKGGGAREERSDDSMLPSIWMRTQRVITKAISLWQISPCLSLPGRCSSMTYWCILHFLRLKSHVAAWPIKRLPLLSLLLTFLFPKDTVAFGSAAFRNETKKNVLLFLQMSLGK